MNRTVVFMVALLMGSFVSCGGEGVQGGPVPLESGSAGVGGSGQGGAGGTGGEMVPLRTIETRHPFGNVDASDNLLWDGDFEWMTAFADQYGWLYNYSFEKPPLALGYRCRSGIKCADMAAGATLIGLGVASQGSALDVSAWVRPESGGCEAVNMELTSLFGSGVGYPVVHDEASPDADGWCHFSAMVPERDRAILLFIENTSDGRLLVDNAVVQPTKQTAMAKKSGLASGGGVTQASRVKARAAARAAMQPRLPPPPLAHRKFEERMKRRRWNFARRGSGAQ